MFRSSTFALAALAAGLSASLITAAEARQIRATVPVEYQAANKEHVRLAEQMQKLRDGARVDLDLLLDIEIAPERVAALGGSGPRARPMRRSVEIGDEATSRLSELVCLTDPNAPLNYTRQHYFRLRLFENFEHVTLKVYPGDKADFPANDVACITDEDAPGKRRVHLRGRFQTLLNATPKGMVIQLRPVR